MRLLAILSTSICTGESDAGKSLQLLIFFGRRDDHLDANSDTHDHDRRASIGGEIATDLAKSVANSAAGGAAGAAVSHFVNKHLHR